MLIYIYNLRFMKGDELMYTALEIARYIIDKCYKDDFLISNLQLQKILYYLQVHFLKNEKEPLFKDDIEAWTYGPVVPNVYYHYSMYGGKEICEKYDDVVSFKPKNKKIINRIIEEKREWLPWDVVEDTHAEGKAWFRIFKNGKGNKDVIPPWIMGFYG